MVVCACISDKPDNMKKYRNAFPIIAVGVLSVFTAASILEAATQGTIGTSSTGTLVVTVSKPAQARISALNDMIVPGWQIGDGAILLTDDICVYSSSAGRYLVNATGSGAGGAFTLSRSGINTIAYTATWNSGGVGNLANTGVALSPGVNTTNRTGAATDSSTCNGANPGPTARLIIRVTNAIMTAAPRGQYTGTITLIATPN
jgi:hypothetical protein